MYVLAVLRWGPDRPALQLVRHTKFFAVPIGQRDLIAFAIRPIRSAELATLIQPPWDKRRLILLSSDPDRPELVVVREPTGA